MKEDKMRFKIWMILILFFATILFTNCGGGESGSQLQAPQSETIEYKLATIDKGYVSRDDVTIIRFKSLLQQLDATYAEDKQNIAGLYSSRSKDA